MAKFKGTVELIGGLTPKNNGDFPLVNAKDIQVDDDGTRLDQKLQQLSAGGGGSGNNSAVVVEILNVDGTATASHTASEIFTLAQAGKILVARVIGENGELCYQYNRSNVAEDGSIIGAVFSITLVGEQLGDVTTYYVSVDDSKDVTITYDELLVEGGDQTAAEMLEGFERDAGSVKTYIDEGFVTLVGSDTGKTVRAIANEELAAKLIPENAQESLNTLAEIAAWIQDHPGDASAMNAAITALQNKVDTGDSTVSAYVTAAISALKIGDYAKAAELTALADRVSALENTTKGLGAMATKDAVTEGDLDAALKEKVNAASDGNHSHNNKAVLDKITEEKVGEWDGKADEDHNHDEKYQPKGNYAAEGHDHDGKYQPVGNYLAEESDPTVPSWAKQPTKPTYTADEVKARPNTWMPTAEDVGARPDTWTPTASDVKADAIGTAATKVTDHNVDIEAHNDIRLLIQGLDARLTALADSDDTTLDQLSELVAYIKANRGFIESITTDKVNVDDIINNLTTNATNKPLSAAQGMALKALIDDLTTTVDGKQTAEQVATAISNALKAYPTTTAMQTAISAALADYAKADHNHDGVYAAKSHNHAGVYQPAGSYADADHNHDGTYAKPADIPTKLSQLTGDSTHRTVTDAQTTAWDNKAAGDHNHDGTYVKTVNGATPDENGNVVVVAKMEQPEFVDGVEKMTDTGKAYVLKSTGEIWTWQSYQTEGSVIPNFTNLYNKEDVVLNKAYITVNQPAEAKDGYYKMGLISYDFSNYDTSNPVTVRIKGKFDVTHTYSRLVYFRSYDIAEEKIRAYQNFNAHVGYTEEADGTISFPLVVKKDGTNVHSEYLLFRAFSFSNWVSDSAITIDNVPDDLIITINEPITYTEVPPQTLYEWRSTGVVYGGDARVDGLVEDVTDLKTTLDNLSVGVIKESEESIYPNFACENDLTIVGDEIWGSKNESTYTRIVRHKIVDGVLTRLSEIKLSDVVHLNTLDYCPENDCLITGNGANDQETTGNCFWIIPNASNLPNLSGTLSLADIAIQYDVDIGYKVQAIWGDGNLGQHNLVYLLSNDNEVRRCIIHKNDDGSFANTYTIVGDKFTITGASGFQGADYYGGYIYFGFGGTNFVLAKVNTKDFAAEVVEYPYCNADGTAIKGVFQGVAVDHNYLWLYPNGIKDSSGNATDNLVKYTR